MNINKNVMKQIVIVTDRQTNRQTNRQTDTQTDRQTDKQTNVPSSTMMWSSSLITIESSTFAVTSR